MDAESGDLILGTLELKLAEGEGLFKCNDGIEKAKLGGLIFCTLELKLAEGEAPFELECDEGIGDADFEDWQEGLPEFQLRLLHFSAAAAAVAAAAFAVSSCNVLTDGLSFPPEDPLGEKNSSSSSSEPSPVALPRFLWNCRGRGGRGWSSGEPNFRYGEFCPVGVPE